MTPLDATHTPVLLVRGHTQVSSSVAARWRAEQEHVHLVQKQLAQWASGSTRRVWRAPVEQGGSAMRKAKLGKTVANPMDASLLEEEPADEVPSRSPAPHPPHSFVRARATRHRAHTHFSPARPCAQEYELAMSGALQKKGDLGNIWNTRFAELRGPWLTYWSSADKAVKKGELHLGGSTVRKDMDSENPVFVILSTDQHQHIHSFRLQPTGDTDTSEFEQWVKAVKKAAANFDRHVVDGSVDISMLHDIEMQEDAKQGGQFPSDMLTWCLVFRVDHGAGGEIPVEALEVARNLAAAHLHVEDMLSKDHARLFLLVGAREDLMIHEATKHCTIDMRLKDIPGTHRFHSDLLDAGHYAPPMYGDGRSAFTSAQRQVLTRSIIFRLAGEDLDDRVNTPNRTKHLKRLQRGVAAMKPQKTWEVENTLDMYGASRRTAAEDLPSCSELMKEVKGDLTGLIDPVQQRWELLERAIEEMERYDQEGMAHFIGHMLSYFPLHCDAELQPLLDRWSTFAVFKTLHVHEKSLVVPGVSYGNVQPSKQIACLYQPLDEIRDYFGEPTALYFAFAGTYCRSMLYPAVLSILTEALHRLRVYPQWVLDSGLVDGSTNSNFYILPYSVFLAVWSIMLLESWKRLEWGLKFLWGSEGFEKDEKPRETFNGVPEENLLTGAVTLVYGNTKSRIVKITLSLSLTMALMALNGVLLYQAIGYQGKQSMQAVVQLVAVASGPNETAVGNSNETAVGNSNETAVGNSTDWDVVWNSTTTWVVVERTGVDFVDRNFYSILAGVLNLFIIVVFGRLYESLAEKLTDWENHRTQTEWDDALTVKSFMFQFVNNYFTLFYIAILRQFPNPFGPANPCQESSCMDDITSQLFIIFCGKIFLAKIVDTSKPFIKRWVGLRLAKVKLQMHMKQMDQLRAFMLLEDGEELEAQRKTELEKVRRMENDAEEGLEITDPFELQERMPPAESLFRNYSSLSIEFGYLSFFSPAFPLACLLAFLANLIDMRSDSIAICRGLSVSRARCVCLCLCLCLCLGLGLGLCLCVSLCVCVCVTLCVSMCCRVTPDSVAARGRYWELVSGAVDDQLHRGHHERLHSGLCVHSDGAEGHRRRGEHREPFPVVQDMDRSHRLRTRGRAAEGRCWVCNARSAALD